MTPPTSSSAAIVVIGNEILSGKVPDSNARFLVEELRKLGVKLEGVFVIPDNWKAIAVLVRRIETLFDHIITTGGIGPTHDDVTMQGIAHGLRTCLKRNEAYEKHVLRFHGSEASESLSKMAELPEETELISVNDCPLPVIKVRNFFVLPGEPTLFKKQFEGIRTRFQGEPFFVKRIFLTVPEEEVAHILENAQNQFPEAEIGSYPDFQNKDYKVQVVIDSKSDLLNQEVAGYIFDRIPKQFVFKSN